MKTIVLLLAITFSFLVCNGQVRKIITNLTPGKLITSMTSDELNTVTFLSISGTMDARDFRIMRDAMPKLSVIDLKEAYIAEYYGTEGMLINFWEAYFANTLPKAAFNGRSSLTSVTLNKSMTAIGNWAFSGCTNLTSVNIPSTVKSIGRDAFSGCKSLITITIPASVTQIDIPAFSNSNPTIIVDPENTQYASIDGLLYNKNHTELIFCPASISGNYAVPVSVKRIGDFAFSGCTKITSITIPNSVTSVGEAAFGSCSSLATIYSYPIIPPVTDLYERTLFVGVDIKNCILYVPAESINLYKAVPDWRNFLKIEAIVPSARKDTANSYVSVWPNPAKDFITANANKGLVSIYNIQGKLEMMQSLQANNKVNISSLNSGVYFVVVNGESSKIVKE